MGDPRGFLTYTSRDLPPKRPVELRLADFREFTLDQDAGAFIAQASRCMDCGVPFCHEGCPLGNRIPMFNHLMYKDDLKRASDELHATNNFPEFTGRACPAPCEDACVLGINQPPVTIKNIEVTIVDRAFAAGLIDAHVPGRISGKTVAVVGSGPAGLAAAQQLTRAGHTVAVYERESRPGGLLRYGIPDFKLEKHLIDRRIEQMREEGTRFRPGINVGTDITLEDLRDRFDAVLIATGAELPRNLNIPGRDLAGVEYAMDYLREQNLCVQTGDSPTLTAKDKHVVIIGGGDTGSDCLGTALRQGAKSVTTLAIGQQPPVDRPADQPWPTTPRIFEVSTSHEEGGERRFLASTVRFNGRGSQVESLTVARTQFTDAGRVPTPGTEETLPADLVLLALGFTGPDMGPWPKLGAAFERKPNFETSIPGVFVAGDAGRGQSLIVWAIAEGRSAAHHMDIYLEGSTLLPNPVTPTLQAMRL